MTHSGDIIYYNAIMYGQGVASSSYATFEDTRTQALLNKASDYLMSVIRFSIDASHIPLFVCQVIPNPLNVNDLNLTPYTVTLQYNNIKYTQNIIFSPDSRFTGSSLQQPPSAVLGQDNTTDYYYIYYYQSFIKMINDAINGAYAAMSAANPGVFTGKPAPYIIYNARDQQISLIIPVITVGANNNAYLTQYDINGLPIYNPQPADTVIFYTNSLLYRFLEGIAAFVIGTGQTTYPNFLFLIDDLKNNGYYPPILNPSNILLNQNPINNTVAGLTSTVSPNYLIFTQEYDSISSWDSLASIVFITRTIPIQPEYIPSQQVNNGNNSTGASSRYILTDFVPNTTRIGEQRGRFIYNPSAQYRYTQLKSDLTLNKVDMQIFWQDKQQNLYPMRISAGEINTIKIMFIRKHLLESDNKLMYKK